MDHYYVKNPLNFLVVATKTDRLLAILDCILNSLNQIKFKKYIRYDEGAT